MVFSVRQLIEKLWEHKERLFITSCGPEKGIGLRPKGGTVEDTEEAWGP